MKDEQEAGRRDAGQKYQGQGREAGVQEGDGQGPDARRGQPVVLGPGQRMVLRPGADWQLEGPGVEAQPDRGSPEAQRASRKRTWENPVVRCSVDPWPGAAAWSWVDRACWRPDGPWAREPEDKVVWKDAATGLDCMARRNGNMGNWCGYVGVPLGHWAHGKGYAEMDEHFEDVDSGAHGGFTFAEPCADSEDGEDPLKMICHPTDAHGPEDKVWWLGFDCAHCDDLSPMIEAWMPDFFDRQSYCTLTYVRSCCEQLAGNLKSAA